MLISPKTRRPKVKAYVLILTLTLLFCCLLLLLSLTIYSQQAALIGSWGKQDLFSQRIAQGVALELESELNGNPGAVPSLTRYPLADAPVAGTLNWGDSSHFEPFQADLAEGLFKTWTSDPPALGYSQGENGSVTTPPWHALAVTTMPDKRAYQTVISTAFPYAAFAPWGSIQVNGKVAGFANPDFNDTFAQESHVPVSVAAGEDIQVSGQFPLGFAQSAEGKISLPQDSGALPRQGLAFPDPYTPSLQNQVEQAMSAIGTRLADKTDFVTGSYLDPEGLYKLISGKEGLTAIFSLQQACSIPMPILPSIIEGEGYQVILLHNPFPSDYKGVAKTLSFIESILSDLLKIVEDAEKAVVEAWKAVGDAAAGVWDDAKGVWDTITGQKKAAEKAFNEANEKYNEAKDHLQSALNDLEDAFDEFKKILELVADAVKPTPPVTMAEEKEMLTFGWAYMGLLARITEDLADFFSAVVGSGAGNWNQLYSDLMNETRVVHFVDRNPLGGFTEDGGFTMLATWTVPRGRTLHLGNSQKPDFTIVGDLWIQQGATLKVEGSLFLEAPSPASKEGEENEGGKAWNYAPTSGMTSEIIPTGTLYLEPGATLIVDGVLYCEGNRDHGSVTITSPAGVTSPLSTAIFCSGDVKLPYGTASGLTLDRMVHYMAKELGIEALQDLADDFIIPVMLDLPPQLAKLDGPFHDRKCWFSDYAVSLVLIDELVEFGLQGPWPIPLPYTNCWKNIFTPLSKVYRVELNFALGENLFTHSNWWIFGQGVVPIVPKVDPKNYSDATREAFEGFASNDLNPKSILETVADHLEEVIPEFAEAVLEEAIQAILKDMVAEAAGGFEDPCAKQKESSQEKKESNFKEKAEEFGQEMLTKFEKKMVTMTGKILSQYRDAIAKDTKDTIKAEAGAARELPGVFIYSGGQLEIGENVPAKAAGFFFAEGDIEIAARSTFGAVVSRGGSINVEGDLYYYPFYSKASLWVPQKPETYGVDTGKTPSYFREFMDVFQDGVYILTPENGSTVSVGSGSATKLAEGYR